MTTRLALLLGLLAMLASGCGDQPVRVGAKEFAEQKILAEMASLMLREQGYRVAPIVRCRDTFTAQRMLRTGRVDLMAEYSGTRWLFDLGPVRPESDTLLQAVRARDAKIGLRWQEPLGFDNRFCLLVTADQAESLGLETIDDLDEIGFPIRVACPPEYLRRPLDGLDALADAYELDLDATVVEPDITRRIEALRDNRVDVVVGYLTDGVIDRFGLRVLEDNIGFFPPYEAAFVVREEVVQRRPAVVEAIEPLEGLLSIEVMRDLVYAVDIEGRDPAEVAREFLRAHDLIDPRPKGDDPRPRVVVALAEGDDLDRDHPMVARALLAVRDAFPEHELGLKSVKRPDLEINQGEARLALVGAERFFRFREQGPPRRVETMQAAAVVGNRLVHVIRRDDGDDPLAGTVGVPLSDSGGGLVARRLLEGRRPDLSAPIPGLLEAVSAGQIDAAVILAEPGDRRIASAMARSEGRLRLVPLLDWLSPERAADNPFLRTARIDQGVHGLDEPIGTLGAQVVLAGATDIRRELAAGPGAALPFGGVPLTAGEVQALADSQSTLVIAPDPALPSAWGLVDEGQEFSLAESIWLTAMNFVALAFLAWLIAQVRRPGVLPEQIRAEAEGDSAGPLASPS